MMVNAGVKLPADSTVKITSDSLLGGQHIAIQPGGSLDDMKPGAQFQNMQGAVDLFGLIGQVIRPQAATPAAAPAPRRPRLPNRLPPILILLRRRNRGVRRLGLLLLAGGVSLGVTAGLALAQEMTTAPKAAPAAAPAPPPSTASAPVATAVAPSVATAPTAASAATPSSEDDSTPKAAVAAAPEAPTPPPEPLKRPRFNAAIMQGVDKITAETLRFEVKVGEPVRYKGLILTVTACETTAADEDAPDSIGYLAVQSQPEMAPGRLVAQPRQVFKGWMFASSPTLHPFEHPVYDLWLIACKTAGPVA